MSSLKWLVVIGLGIGHVQLLAAEAKLTNTTLARHAASGVVVVAGEVVLPGRGVWHVVEEPLPAGCVLERVLLDPPEAVMEAAYGERGRALRLQRRERDHRTALRSVYWPLCQWAYDHEGRLPGPGDEPDERLAKTLERALSSLPIASSSLLTVPVPPHAMLVPDAVIEFDIPRYPNHRYFHGTNGVPILVELHPLEDDGKHHVLLANGRIERRTVDPELMARVGGAVVPLRLDPASGGYPETARYRLLAQYRKDRTGPGLLLTNSLTQATLRLPPPSVAAAGEGDPALLAEWSEAIADEWDAASADYDAPGLRMWVWIQKQMLEGGSGRHMPDAPQERPSTDMMGVLGGRAALRETLQLQALRMTREEGTQSVDMASIKGVEVKSHPFAEMLAGSPGGEFPIAEFLPADHFFVGISKPEALMPLLDEGAAFLARVGAGATGRALRYDLKERYLSALGLNESMVRAMVANGAIAEIAISSPDLFFADGTELSVVARMKGVGGVRMLLSLCGIKTSGDGPVKVELPDGAAAHWAVAGDLVIMGTRAADVARILELVRSGGKGSLGQSDEFRYMLTRVPRTDATRAYVYFSDPFIRRLVGPEVKIGQLRRMREKARLQAVAYAGMLQAYHSGGAEETSLDGLVAAGYLSAALASGLSLDDSGVPHSTVYGALPRMRSVYAADLTQATRAEEDAYDSYKESYTRFWRRFFDPVAMRLDEDGSELVATTYILPLLDNSLYNGVRRIINADSGLPLRVPHLSPDPTAMLSLNLNENAWREAISDQMLELAESMGADMGALDQLGPACHVAIFDGEPVIATGSRAMLGMGGRIGGRFNEEMAIPLVVSLLTRPCALLVELQDPEPVLQLLASGFLPNVFGDLSREGQAVSYRVAGHNSWVMGLDFWGMSLRFSISVEGNYLVVGNMPWREPIHVTGVSDAAAAGASVRLLPGAVDIEARALQLSALEGEREAVMQALSYLHPLLAAGISPDAVVSRHAELFGYAPILPDGLLPAWDGLSPSLAGYGSVFSQEQPPVNPDATFGTLRGVGQASASMQLEDTGLRTIVRWTYGDEEPPR